MFRDIIHVPIVRGLRLTWMMAQTRHLTRKVGNTGNLLKKQETTIENGRLRRPFCHPVFLSQKFVDFQHSSTSMNNSRARHLAPFTLSSCRWPWSPPWHHCSYVAQTIAIINYFCFFLQKRRAKKRTTHSNHRNDYCCNGQGWSSSLDAFYMVVWMMTLIAPMTSLPQLPPVLV